jgi:hypothetical protein
MMKSTFANEILTIRLFRGQRKTEIFSYYFSATLNAEVHVGLIREQLLARLLINSFPAKEIVPTKGKIFVKIKTG